MPLTKRNVEVPLPCSTRTDLTVENLISTQTTQEQSFKKTNLIQLTQILGQLSQISQYANELFSGLIKQSNDTFERINNIKTRINNLNANINQVDKKMGMMKVSIIPNPELIEFKPQEFVPEADLFTKQSESFAINEAYQKCKDIPNFSEIDKFRTDGKKCAKLYSDPDFFLEQWKDVMNRDIEARKKKKEERKKDKIKVKKEKKQIRELSKKQYNSDGEVINQERLSEYRKSKLSQPDSVITESVTPMTMDIPSMMAPPAPSAPTMVSNAPPPPAMPSVPAAPPVPLPFMPQQPQMGSIGQIPPPLPSMGISSIPPMPMPTPVGSNAPPPPPPPAVSTAPPPPPPPAMTATNAPPPPPPPAAPSGGGLPTINANALQNVQLRSASAAPAPAPAPTNTRDDLLSNIKMGGFKLRKVEVNEKRKPNDDLEGRDDVAALLIRRVALEDSDSESEESDSDSDDWD
jgi:hypothetical protein